MTDQPCIDAGDLMDIGDIANALGCTRSSVRTIIARSTKSNHPFPPSIRENIRAWIGEDVEKWIAARPGAGRGPRPGRRQSDIQRMRALAGERTYLTAGQMSRLLGVTIEQLSRMRTNAPRPTKAGSYIRYEIAAIVEWLNQRDAKDNGARAS